MSDQQGPSPEDIKRQEELNTLKQEELSYSQQQARLNRENAEISNGLIDDLNFALGVREKNTQSEKQLLKLNKDINSSIDKQKVGLSTVKQVSNQIEKNENLINKAKATANALTKDLSAEEQDIIKALKEEHTNLRESNNLKEKLLEKAGQGVAIDTDQLKELDKKIAASEAEIQAGTELLGVEDSITGKYAVRALLTEQQAEQLERENKLRQEELDKLEKIEKAFGFAGSAAKALGQLPIVGSAFTQSLSGAQARVKEIVEETGELPSRLERAKIFTEEFAGVVKKASLAFIVNQALALNKGLVEVGRTLGISKSEIKSINQELRDTEAASGNVFTTDSERLGTLNRISKTLGMNAKILGVENVAGAARLEQSLGLAAEAADGLATLSALSGDEILNVADNVYDLTSEFNDTNKTAFNGKNILEEVGKTSKSIGALFAFNTTELTKATLEAKKLGLSLEQVNGIAGNLLQFEDSITAELEAELFLGQDINLEKARQLALTNDLGVLSKELANNEAVRQAFASKNRFTIEKTAKALGMSVESMSQMFYQQELNNMSAEQFDATYGDQNRKAAEQLTIQQNMEKALAKLAEAATPFVELMATLLSHTSTIYTVLGLVAGVQIMKFLKGLRAAYKMVKAIRVVEIGSAVAKGWSAAMSSPQSLLTGGLAGLAVGASITAAIMSATSKAPPTPADDLFSAGKSGYGKRTLLAPDGAYALNDNDNILATTNKIKPVNDMLVTGEEGSIDVVNSTKRSGNAATEPGIAQGINTLITEIRTLRESLSGTAELKVDLDTFGTITQKALVGKPAGMATTV